MRLRRYRRRALVPHVRRWAVVNMWEGTVVKQCFTHGGALVHAVQLDPDLIRFTVGRL